ncbi:hypothetical protein H0B56_17185 [Haloechinothrix sp. YIM 98757]|uniref:Uncharacterized protein n=1 Tax=Haloechinothrix aidingensis TaxID=2752311 RepID=A0A838ADM0_9PSEU|nr:DUF6338 family protein [Haloechinothrix aidingensis]MBA0127287.1 hypothetical protein [Haloechinothrix aidingensis]
MPSTLTGLLLFVVLLLPGFIFATALRRERPEQRPSPLHETAAIALASVLSELIVLGIFAVIHVLAPEWTPNIRQLIAAPQRYLATSYLLMFTWMVILLVAACATAWIAAILARRRPVHPSGGSAWWLLFETFGRDRDRHVGVMLDDGSYLHGTLSSFNQSEADTADRDLVLMTPITYRPSGAAETTELDCGAACVSARHIVAMTVAYVPRPATSQSSDSETEVAETAASPD